MYRTEGVIKRNTASYLHTRLPRAYRKLDKVRRGIFHEGPPRLYPGSRSFLFPYHGWRRKVWKFGVYRSSKMTSSSLLYHDLRVYAIRESGWININWPISAIFFKSLFFGGRTRKLFWPPFHKILEGDPQLPTPPRLSEERLIISALKSLIQLWRSLKLSRLFFYRKQSSSILTSFRTVLKIF